MNKLISYAMFLGIILSPLTSTAVNIDPAMLVKVSPDNNAKCIEYYSRNGALYCSTIAFQSQTVDPSLVQHEKLNIMFDDRYWVAAWGKNDPALTTIEYIPSGDNINHWNELITSQFFPDVPEKITPKQFAELFLQQLRDSGYQPIVSFLEDTNKRVIFEFRVDQPKNQIQDELQMVTKNKNGLYVLHYAIKTADMGPKNREKWLHNLKNSSIKK